MNKEPLWSRPTVDEIAEGDRILVTHSRAGGWATLGQIKECVGTTEDPVELGVPVPTTEDAGNAMTVSANLVGFALLPAFDAELIWTNDNPTEDFPKQTIESDNAAYTLFIVIFRCYFVDGGWRNKTTIIPKGANVSLRNIVVTVANDPPFVRVYRRNISADDSGFYVESCYTDSYFGDGDHWDGRDDECCSPIAIYGIRKGRA